VNRDEMLDRKAKEIQSELTKWAEENGILGSREQIVFSFSIRNLLSVECVDPKEIQRRSLLDMSIYVFIDEMSQKLNWRNGLTSRLRHAIRNVEVNEDGAYRQLKTVEDVTKCFARDLVLHKYFGNCALSLIKAALASVGLYLAGEGSS